MEGACQRPVAPRAKGYNASPAVARLPLVPMSRQTFEFRPLAEGRFPARDGLCVYHYVLFQLQHCRA